MLNRTFKITILTCVFAAGMLPVYGQQHLSGRRQYPQFRTTSGLPGSGFSIGSDGLPSGKGAISISIPVAYSLGQGVWVGGISFAGRDMRPRIPRFDSNEDEFRGNGTAWIMTGFGGSWGRLTASYMALSSDFDGAFNLLYTPPKQESPVVFAIGVQDLAGDGGAGGETVDDQDHSSSRSIFGTATWNIKANLYATAGLGSNRFRFGFAGICWNLDPKWSVTAEHDGYNFNGGVAYRFGTERLGKKPFGSLMVGTIRGQYLYMSLTFGF